MVVASVGVGACADGTDDNVAEVPTAVVVVGEMESESGLASRIEGSFSSCP